MQKLKAFREKTHAFHSMSIIKEAFQIFMILWSEVWNHGTFLPLS